MNNQDNKIRGEKSRLKQKQSDNNICNTETFEIFNFKSTSTPTFHLRFKHFF